MNVLYNEGDFKNRADISQAGDNEFYWHEKFKYNPEINKEGFPKFVEKVSEIKDEIIERYPLLVLNDLHGKIRTGKLVKTLTSLSILDKNGKVIADKLQDINNDDIYTIVGELKKMKLRDYGYLREILKKWKGNLDNNELDLFNKCGIGIDKIQGDVEKWLEKMQELKDIREELFLNNMPVVFSVAHSSKYDSLTSPYNLQDRIGFGAMGLNYAIDNFSPNKGMSFANYARWPIMSNIDRHIFSDFGRSKIGQLAKRYLDRQGELEVKNSRLANDEEMARMLGVGMDDITEARLFLERHQQKYRLDSPIGGDEEGTTHKDSLTVGNKDNPEYLTERKLSKELFWNVTEEIFGRDSRELAILKKRAEGKTLEDIAQEFNVTRERIRQIEKAAKDRLRDNLELRGYRLDDFLS